MVLFTGPFDIWFLKPISFEGIKNAVLYLSMFDGSIAFYNTDGHKLFYRILIRNLLKSTYFLA